MLRRRADGWRAIVRVKGLPAIELRLRREPAAEHLKALRSFFRGEKLYVALVFAEEASPLEPTGRSTGIDLGVNSRVALSDGTLVEGASRTAAAPALRPARRRDAAQPAAQPQRGARADHGAGAALTTASPWRTCGSRT